MNLAVFSLSFFIFHAKQNKKKGLKESVELYKQWIIKRTECSKF